MPPVLVIGQVVLLGGPPRADDLGCTAQHGDPLQAISGIGLVMLDVLTAEPHWLVGEGMGYVIPDMPGGVSPGLHQVRGQRDQLGRPPGARVAVNPIVGVSIDQPVGLQQLLAHAWCHGLIGADVQQAQHGMPGDARLGAVVDHIVREFAHGIRENLDAPVHGRELHGGCLPRVAQGIRQA
ncbi:hypothetical protein SDC9_85022 [bioreactor metagenome]|uniref:Uncharacterized protein n=1 Tax=bioreactor metagenome TaxID=1076179 RepID=A0A644ZI71_9ZZZZ